MFARKSLSNAHPLIRKNPHVLAVARRSCRNILCLAALLVCSTAFAQMLLPDTETPTYSIIAGGDVMLGRRTAKNIQKYGYDYPWKYVAPTFATADIAFINLEGVASWKGTALDKRYTFAL